MQIICTNTLRRSEYKKITAQVYAGNPHFRDSLSSVLAIVTNPKGAFGSRTQQQAVVVKDDKGAPLATALLIRAEGLPDQVQLSFFEALPNAQEAVQALVDKASSIARQWGATNLLVSMNGHVNYGLGFLADSFDELPCFGSSYTPPYYIDYFRSLGFAEQHLVSYRYPMDSFVKQQEDKILERTKKRFNFRQADFSHLQEEINIYTQLNNECFSDHPAYFHRHEDEDYELFKPFRWFLQEENLLIAEHGGIPVGFLLWYPDFNELIGPGQELGIQALLKYKLLRRPIKRFKIVEIGVIPKFQGSSVILGLFHACYELTRDRFQECESGWIFSENLKSNNICRRWNPENGPSYSVLTLALQ
ncbi:GNAT family N-acetyltransferase [Candidatus Electrothrix laxa]